MTNGTFRPRGYFKEGCPFSFKLLVFLAEAGLVDRIEITRLNENDPGFERAKARLAEGLGKPATFPTVEVEPGKYMSDSDKLIELFAERNGVAAEQLPVLSFYKQTILPKLRELHEIKAASKNS